MEKKYQFIITRCCPREEIFRGEMTFTEARKFMDENASLERCVGFEVFNDAEGRWERNNNVSFYGGRKVYDNGYLKIIDPDYKGMWIPEACRWYVWEVSNGRRFVVSLGSKEGADNAAAMYQKWSDDVNDHRQYVVEPCDIKTL